MRGEPSPVRIDKKPALDALGGRAGYAAFVPPRSRRKSGRELTAMDVWGDQAGWLLQFATDRKDRLEGEDPRTIAAGWARRAGIPPRAIARALGYANGHSVSVVLDSLHDRAKEQPDLRRVLSLREI